MRRRRDRTSTRDHRIEHRCGQRFAFAWIGTSSEFVEKHQNTGPRFFQNCREVLHVRTKRRQVLVQVLVVTYVCQDNLERCNTRTFIRRNRQTGS